MWSRSTPVSPVRRYHVDGYPRHADAARSATLPVPLSGALRGQLGDCRKSREIAILTAWAQGVAGSNPVAPISIQRGTLSEVEGSPSHFSASGVKQGSTCRAMLSVAAPLDSAPPLDNWLQIGQLLVGPIPSSTPSCNRRLVLSPIIERVYTSGIDQARDCEYHC